ncbi:MAG: hypothetical protein K940chlam5_00030 [Candidatus Anoxychlamydiales bacterium]|nr:hypothetical protein [Candidatus Anoxychlamydiales bacterium]
MTVIYLASDIDFVPYSDPMRYNRNIESVVRIKPHPNAKFHDHNFNSPTYENFLRDNIGSYAQ